MSLEFMGTCTCFLPAQRPQGVEDATGNGKDSCGQVRCSALNLSTEARTPLKAAGIFSASETPHF